VFTPSELSTAEDSRLIKTLLPATAPAFRLGPGYKGSTREIAFDGPLDAGADGWAAVGSIVLTPAPKPGK